jgi:hypothetical protein
MDDESSLANATRQVLLTNSLPIPRNYQFVNQPLNKHSAEAFSDILSLEWGLSKLALEGGMIDHDDVSGPCVA